MLIHIYQEKKTGAISGVYRKSEIPTGEYYFDCDSDSFLIQGDYPATNYESVSSSNYIGEGDLTPVIAQEENGRILMQAFTNRDSLESSLLTGYAHYYSRSRNKLWKKGEESGHLQKILSIHFYKEHNFFVYKVEQTGAACHTNYYSCFYRKYSNGIESVIYSEKFNPEVKE